MLKTLITALIILISQSAIACGSLAGGGAQYEKNIEDGIAMQKQQLKKYQNLGFADDSEAVKAAKKSYLEAKESQPISKNVDVEKYNKIYNGCVAKLNAKNDTTSAPVAPCGNEYTIKECTHEAYEGSKK